MTTEKIQINGTNKTPKIVFEAKDGLIKILGRSTMENPHEFYPSIIHLVKKYCTHPPKKTLLIIDLEYYNTLSVKYLLMIIEIISQIELNSIGKVKINWYFDPEDFEMENDINFYSGLLHYKINALSYAFA